MGMTKAIMEKLVRSEDYPSATTSVVTRYGNVIGSRGSVIPQFIESIKKTGEVNVTDLQMTRFMMSLDESVDLVLFALANGEQGDLFVQKSPAATVETIVNALSILMARENIKTNLIGIRPGEKTHETLLTSEERSLAIEHEKYFQVKKRLGSETSVTKGSESHAEYTSENTDNLNPEQLANMLSSIPYIINSIKH
jgi:UDP-glucose 4-epimerase